VDSHATASCFVMKVKGADREVPPWSVYLACQRPLGSLRTFPKPDRFAMGPRFTLARVPVAGYSPVRLCLCLTGVTVRNIGGIPSDISLERRLYGIYDQ
jgi:hypothetical protein